MRQFALLLYDDRAGDVRSSESRSRLRRHALSSRPSVPRSRPSASASASGDPRGAGRLGAPSDAIVLFDGKLVNGDALSQWQSAKGNWKVADGYFQVVPGAGDLATKQKFGDVQLHVEWAAPVEIRGNSQNRT